jgi:cytochrome c1
MRRHTIAAASLPNDNLTLAHWIADPQRFKPGSLMPAPPLTQTELTDIVTYLHTLD